MAAAHSLLAAAAALPIALAVALPASAAPAGVGDVARWHLPMQTDTRTSWSKLTPAQRNALAPLARVWPGIEPEQQRRWLALAERYPRVPAPEQARIQARMTDWARMTPQQRGQARLQFREAQRLAPADRQALWNAYQALPPEQRRQWAERAAKAASSSSAARRPVAAAAEPGASRPSVAHGLPRLQPVTPAIVKAGPGATTELISRSSAPPAHLRPGMPKIAVDADDVNRTTLLPRRGAQSATFVSSAALRPASAPSR